MLMMIIWSYDHDDSQAFIRMIASIIALSLSLSLSSWFWLQLHATIMTCHDYDVFFVPRGVRSTRQGKMPKLIKQHTSACQWRGTGCWTHTVAERKSLYVFVPRAESGVRGKGKCQNWLSNTASACHWRGTGCWTHTVAERKSLYVSVCAWAWRLAKISGAKTVQCKSILPLR